MDSPWFYVAYDELSVNRLIHSTLAGLLPQVSSDENRQCLRELLTVFADVPASADLHDDWRKHHVDRSMRHYEQVMRWVGLFLFNPRACDVLRASRQPLAAVPAGAGARISSHTAFGATKTTTPSSARVRNGHWRSTIATRSMNPVLSLAGAGDARVGMGL